MAGLKKIVSGGQTGADQGGLAAAAQLGLETGGFAPPGYLTASGHNPALLRDVYGLVETSGGGSSVARMYASRTQLNIADSQATVAFWLRPSPGTDCTVGYCLFRAWYRAPKSLRVAGDACARMPAGKEPFRPLFIVTDLASEEQQQQLRAFVDARGVGVLNVAGHRDADLSAAVTEFLVHSLA